MVRPLINRNIRFNPHITYYKPAGIPIKELEEVLIEVDELEALRLCDSLGLKQEDAAKKMEISQSTLFRLLNSARNKIANALINGKAIKINKK